MSDATGSGPPAGDDRDGGEMEQVNVEVPTADKQALKERGEHGVLSRVVRQAIRREARDESLADVKRVNENSARQWAATDAAITDVKRRLDNRAGQSGALTLDVVLAELDQLRRDRAHAVALAERDRQSDVHADRGERYKSKLAELEEFLAESERTQVFPEHGDVKDAARISGQPPEDVIADLKERNPSLPERRFTDGSKDRHKRIAADFRTVRRDSGAAVSRGDD